nr:transcription initiation factor TFIID subunit 11-like [Ipomoea batatas]
MEGVGARFGRTSSRYGPTTVFTGRVRKWRKKWIHVKPPSSGSSNLHHHHRAAANSELNDINGSRLLLLKWTPITPSQNNSNGAGDADKNGNSKSSAKDDVVADELPKRKFKYIPIVLLEEQNNESLEMAEDEAKPIETEMDAEKTTPTDGLDEKPDINDAPMEKNQAGTARHDLNESTLDLSLGLKAHDGEADPDSKTNQTKGGHSSTVNSNRS